MRILHVSNFFKPSFESGGVAISCYSITKNLVELNHDITVYTTNRNKVATNVITNKKVVVDGIKVYYFENLKKYFPFKIPPLPYYSLFIIRKQIREFDLIHIHEHRTLLAIVVHHYAIKNGIPYVLQPRGSIPKMSKSIQKSIFDLIVGKKIIENASKIIASSKIESEQYKQVFPEIIEDKIINIPNGIDLKEYSNLPKYGCFKKEYSINHDKKIVLFLSRIHERKGADILIEAFSLVKTSLSNIMLVIVGPDGGYLKKLKSDVIYFNLESDVLFTGPLHGIDKLAAYVDANVFVLPSKDKYESFGNVVIEACACGTPVIITNNCGVGEYISSECGYIIDADTFSLKNAILDLLTNEEKSKKLGEYGRQLVLTTLSYDKVIQDYEKLYRNVVNAI